MAGRIHSGSWPEVTVGDVVTLQRGFDITKAEQSQGPYPVISSSGPTSSHATFKVEPPGVVIGRKGSLGGVYFSEAPFWPHDTTLWVKDFHGNDPKFVYYWLRTLGLENYDVGASNPTLNRNHIHLLVASIPPRQTQHKIVAILSAYDDLIENNHRRIKILDEMAQRTYREWFVDLRYPGHEDVSLKDSPLGPVPEHWAVRPLGEVVDDVRHSVRAGTVTADRAYVPIDCISPRSLALVDWKPGFEAASSLLTFNRGDILFGAMRPYFHKVALAPWTGTTRTTCFVLRVPLASDYSFAVMTLFDDRTIEYATSHSSGTTIPYARWKGALADKLVAVPDARTISRFDAAIRPSLDFLTDAGARLANLCETRDLLLPRLLSGEIDVADLDITMAELAA